MSRLFVRVSFCYLSRFISHHCFVVNSCAAFAFVKFDNTEAPARAVFEEVGDVFTPSNRSINWIYL